MSVPWPLVRSNAGGSFASFSSEVSRARNACRALTSPNGNRRGRRRSRARARRRRAGGSRARSRPARARGDVPFARGDLRVLAHALAGRAVADRRDVELDVAQSQVGDVRDLLAERARLREAADPVGQRLPEPELDAAQALGAADQRERAVDRRSACPRLRSPRSCWSSTPSRSRTRGSSAARPRPSALRARCCSR